MSERDTLRVEVAPAYAILYRDGYQRFGWKVVEAADAVSGNAAALTLERSRAIPNRAELTRLQRNFEAYMKELAHLQASPKAWANSAGLACGVAGAAMLAGATFAGTAAPPVIWLSLLLAVPGFLLTLGAYPAWKQVYYRRECRVAPIIENKHAEIEEICRKAEKLLQM